LAPTRHRPGTDPAHGTGNHNCTCARSGCRSGCRQAQISKTATAPARFALPVGTPAGTYWCSCSTPRPRGARLHRRTALVWSTEPIFVK